MATPDLPSCLGQPPRALCQQNPGAWQPDAIPSSEHILNRLRGEQGEGLDVPKNGQSWLCWANLHQRASVCTGVCPGSRAGQRQPGSAARDSLAVSWTPRGELSMRFL